ncbi:hypothetical protein [uncultured Jannaschia sp.]|uniref:hypothetical protein n=1 Tax=uncultured Jannaschia sp. TaxID=293347 RepID=UPI0026220B28|nr:hypothetical protein [uncultured Jannaschia sp.]
MDRIQDLLRRVDKYAADNGVTPATVCRYATGNFRLYERIQSRLKKLEDDAERIEQFLDNREAVPASPEPQPTPDPKCGPAQAEAV